MGTVARVVRDADGGVDVASVFAELDRRLSRFDASSDLSRLNADPRACVPAAPLERHGRCAVDCGGDLRVAAGRGAPWEVRVRHPLTGAIAHTLRVRAGGVATSGIDARLWQRPRGDFAHHLIDPATRTPAWT